MWKWNVLFHGTKSFIVVWLQAALAGIVLLLIISITHVTTYIHIESQSTEGAGMCSRTFRCVFWIFLSLVSWIFLVAGWPPLYTDRVNSSLGYILNPKGNKTIPRPWSTNVSSPGLHVLLYWTTLIDPETLPLSKGELLHCNIVCKMTYNNFALKIHKIASKFVGF